MPPAMKGDAIKSATSGFGQDGNPNVSASTSPTTGSKTFQEITRDLYRTGLLKQTPQTFSIVYDNVLISDPMIDYTKPDLRDGISGSAEISGGNMTVQEAKDLAFFLNLGALPVQAGHRLPAGGLGHARQGFAQPGPHRRAHRPRHRPALHAALLPLPRAGRRPRAHRVRDPPLGPLQPDPRDAHAARHRRHDPHHRRGRRRQRGHLRAHQGRGAPRQDGALGGQLRLRARLQDHPRRQRAHHAHGAGAVPVRDGRPQGLRVHAHHRRDRQHAHRRAVHPGHARRARRVRLLQQAVVHGRQGRPGRHRDGRDGRHPRRRFAQAPRRGRGAGRSGSGAASEPAADGRAAPPTARHPGRAPSRPPTASARSGDSR